MSSLIWAVPATIAVGICWLWVATSAFSFGYVAGGLGLALLCFAVSVLQAIGGLKYFLAVRPLTPVAGHAAALLWFFASALMFWFTLGAAEGHVAGLDGRNVDGFTKVLAEVFQVEPVEMMGVPVYGLYLFAWGAATFGLFSTWVPILQQEGRDLVTLYWQGTHPDQERSPGILARIENMITALAPKPKQIPAPVVKVERPRKGDERSVHEFFRDATVSDQKTVVEGDKMYAAYVAYCQERGILEPVARNAFGHFARSHVTALKGKTGSMDYGGRKLLAPPAVPSPVRRF